MLGEPHAPANADAGELEEFPPVDDPPVDVPPAAPLFPGAVGLKSFDVFSNAQPVASVDASNRLRKETVFIEMPLQFCIGTHSSGMYPRSAAQNS